MANYTVDENAGVVTLSVTRPARTGTTTVNYATSDGTATAGSDYAATNGTLTFNEGESLKTFTVPILNDSDSETTENFNVTLSGVSSDATLGAPVTARISIRDDDSPNLITITGSVVPEGDAGTSFAAFTPLYRAPAIRPSPSTTRLRTARQKLPTGITNRLREA